MGSSSFLSIEGSPDHLIRQMVRRIQSLADLAKSSAIVQHIRPVPFGREAIIAVAVFVALTLLPLCLTRFSFRELVARPVDVLLQVLS